MPLTVAVANAAARPAIARHFYDLNLRQRVVLCQLPLLVTTLVAVALSALVYPDTLTSRTVHAGMIVQVGLLLACALVPWEKLPRGSYLLIPILDFASIALLREGSIGAMAGLGLLAVFPVIWLTASNIAPRASVAASFFFTLLAVWVPLVWHRDFVVEDFLRPLLLPLVMLAIGISVHVVNVSMLAQRTALEEKDQELNRALDASRRREQLMNAIVDTINVGLLAVDGAGNDVVMNRQQRRFHKLAAPEGNPDPNETQLLIFDSDRNTLIPPEQRPVRRAVLGETFADRLVWIGSGASQRAMSVTARPIRDDDGKFAGSVVAFSDVTDLVTALAAKDDFVSNISHELRTPLTSILGYLGLALEEDSMLPPDVVQFLKVAERNAERLLDLVSDLLSIASHQMNLQPVPTDLSEVIGLSMDSAAPRAAENGVELVNEVAEPLMAEIDGARMGQVLDNLLSNAIKYSPDGGTVTVRAWADRDSVSFEVADTGIGMDEAEQAAAFTKFFRAGAVRRTAIPGVGLGLLITKTIVESHRGSIAVKSARGAGSTFTVTLPLGYVEQLRHDDGVEREDVAGGGAAGEREGAEGAGGEGAGGEGAAREGAPAGHRE